MSLRHIIQRAQERYGAHLDRCSVGIIAALIRDRGPGVVFCRRTAPDVCLFWVQLASARVLVVYNETTGCVVTILPKGAKQASARHRMTGSGDKGHRPHEHQSRRRAAQVRGRRLEQVADDLDDSVGEVLGR